MKMKMLFFLLGTLCWLAPKAQKVEGIYFNLYTDSLKKGFFNYINIDAKMADGTWQPLDSNSISFSANTGFFKGNDLFIDSSYKCETVRVKATLKKDPKVYKEVTIYIRKRGFDEPLKTEQQIIDDLKKEKVKVKRKGR
jgi:hypothetical protein